MQVYEIRVLRDDLSTAVVIEMLLFSDSAAIKTGEKIAEARPFEVWKDLDCIYGRALSQRRFNFPVSRPAA